jgi:hypothetical protein
LIQIRIQKAGKLGEKISLARKQPSPKNALRLCQTD